MHAYLVNIENKSKHQINKLLFFIPWRKIMHFNFTKILETNTLKSGGGLFLDKTSNYFQSIPLICTFSREGLIKISVLRIKFLQRRVEQEPRNSLLVPSSSSFHFHRWFSGSEHGNFRYLCWIKKDYLPGSRFSLFHQQATTESSGMKTGSCHRLTIRTYILP